MLIRAQRLKKGSGEFVNLYNNPLDLYAGFNNNSIKIGFTFRL